MKLTHPAQKFGFRPRPGEQIALQYVCAHHGQRLGLKRIVHSFGHHRKAQPMGKRDDRVADRRRLAAMGDVGDERAVDLQPGDWERPEPGEIGIADSEIIYCDLQRSEEHTSELQTIQRNKDAVYGRKKKNKNKSKKKHK